MNTGYSQALYSEPSKYITRYLNTNNVNEYSLSADINSSTRPSPIVDSIVSRGNAEKKYIYIMQYTLVCFNEGYRCIIKNNRSGSWLYYFSVPWKAILQLNRLEQFTSLLEVDTMKPCGAVGQR